MRRRLATDRLSSNTLTAGRFSFKFDLVRVGKNNGRCLGLKLGNARTACLPASQPDILGLGEGRSGDFRKDKDGIMQTPIMAQVKIAVDKDGLSAFFLLLQQKFMVKARIGISVRQLLCDSFGLDPAYVEGRIQTIFLDGQPVDNLDRAAARDGVTLALSAAMPGLVGAVMRAGGPLSPFRSTISYRGDAADIKPGEGIVSLKLFNLLTRELGPGFLKRGILIRAAELGEFLKALPARVHPHITAAQVDGSPVALEELIQRDWAALNGILGLTVEGP
jgi:hypothetical protein